MTDTLPPTGPPPGPATPAPNLPWQSPPREPRQAKAKIVVLGAGILIGVLGLAGVGVIAGTQLASPEDRIDARFPTACERLENLGDKMDTLAVDGYNTALDASELALQGTDVLNSQINNILNFGSVEEWDALLVEEQRLINEHNAKIGEADVLTGEYQATRDTFFDAVDECDAQRSRAERNDDF
jgi:hypothetical protein